MKNRPAVDYTEFDELLATDPNVEFMSRIETIFPSIPNGFLSLTLPCGTEKHFWIYRKQIRAKEWMGRRIIAILVGPEPKKMHDYEDFGLVYETGIQILITGQPKYKQYAELIEKIVAGGEIIDGHEWSIEKRCLICNRKLAKNWYKHGIGDKCHARFKRYQNAKEDDTNA